MTEVARELNEQDLEAVAGGKAVGGAYLGTKLTGGSPVGGAAGAAGGKLLGAGKLTGVL